MKPRPPFELPAEVKELFERAVRFEWISHSR